jgi:SAM-dependent methyltransferase
MSIFGKYSDYYDLLYTDKAYAAEAEQVHTIIQRNKPGARSILELGCGTGAHAMHLVKKGYRIHGVDVSAAMLDRAERNRADLALPLSRMLSYSKADIRNVRCNDRFDAVISLFHVISYLPQNNDILAAIRTAKYHLKPGGIFMFDCWYGPAVLTDRPQVREKQLENENLHITRIAEPRMMANANIVEVNYQVTVTNKETGKVEKLTETHLMRYLFKPEIELIFSTGGVQIVDFFEWMTGSEPGFDTWNVCFVGRVSK